MNKLSAWRGSFPACPGKFAEPLSRRVFRCCRLAILLMPLLAFAQRPGYNLSLADAQRLEEKLQKDPDDLSAHTTLLGYYFRNRSDVAPEKLKEARRRHVLWMIEHHPEDQLTGFPEAKLNPGGYMGDAEGYVQAVAAWRKAVEKQGVSSAVLINAARFFSLEDIEFAASLLERALMADSTNSRAAEALAYNYQSRARRPEDQANGAAFARKAFKQMERATTLANEPEDRFANLPILATMAFDAGDYPKARTYAAESLKAAGQFPKNWNYGNAIHKGNMVLGRLAIQGGDLEEAKKYLLAAGKTPGSPQLNSFGPNMALALELLKKGERDVVLQYFALCGQFWTNDRGKLAEWAATVRGGGIPNFGTSLVH